MRLELLFGLLRRRRAVVLGALAAVSAAAWTFLLLGAGIGMQMEKTAVLAPALVVLKKSTRLFGAKTPSDPSLLCLLAVGLGVGYRDRATNNAP